MPAILCPSCRKLINSDEPRCPYCGQVRPGMFGLTTFLRRLGLQVDFPHLITVVCVALYGLSLLLDPGAIFRPHGLMGILAPSMQSSLDVGMSGAYPVFQERRWWTIFTAIYLHGGLIHILFNMMWVRQLGPLVKELFGPFRLFVIFTVSGVVGFVVSSFMGNAFTLGASGSIFGLLAAAIVYGRQRRSTMFTRQFLQWAVMLFIFGLFFDGVDNSAHAGGFVGGYVTALAFSRQQSEREGLGTYLLAGLCLVSTLTAFGLQLLWALVV